MQWLITFGPDICFADLSAMLAACDVAPPAEAHLIPFDDGSATVEITATEEQAACLKGQTGLQIFPSSEMSPY
ncbi:hypothetical protein RXV86_19475 [Alisedimentitalea sp. MJ-SS2]|uniref:hypothetical protein n=1 Tax=Aliisedimentitalea sp. MJ-SS2 TaxID=3049795 RepID=UPI0029117ED6|nr:hypothetical protein [Alisedimentitalea sp. MJ-SS2]MDU8929577.1 hypothetical protein [Alisedimentitalea sp. MJ-SS2]